MKTKNESIGHIFAVITILIWGTTFISTKILLDSFTPIEILFIRFAIGYVALSIVYPSRLKISNRKHEIYFAAAGICGITLYYLFENIALTYTLASNVGIIISISPFFTAIFTYIFLKGERPKIQFLIGFIVALAGVIMISFNGQSEFKINPTGDILSVLAAAVWSIYSLLSKKISGFGFNIVQSTRRIFFYGIIFMIPILFILDFSPEMGNIVKPVNLFNILFLGLFASAVCFVTWNSSVRILGPVKTSVYIYLVPVITVITSAIVLKEDISVNSVLGIILTMFGLIISENRFNSRKIKEVIVK